MTVLCYHAVQPGWTAPMSMEPDAFATHAAWLARHREVVPLHAGLDRLGSSGRLSRGQVALTFDDGFASVHEHALPELRRHSLPATVFLVARTFVDDEPADWMDRPPSSPPPVLDEEQVREMQAAGVTFESHSWRHADLTSLDYATCVDDLRQSRELLESVLRHPVRLLAYPRGRHDADVRRAAERAGYDYAFALPDGREEPGRYAVPRVGVYHGNTVKHLRLKTSPGYLAVRSSALAARSSVNATRRNG